MRYRNVQLGFCVAFEDLRVDYVGSEVEDGLGLVVDVLVARFCDGSDAPLHVLSVELELGFGDVVVVLGLGQSFGSLRWTTGRHVRFPH